MAYRRTLFTRKKTLLLTCLPGIFLFIVALSWGSYRFFWDNKVSQLTWNESEILSRSASTFSREMGHIKRVTLLLRNSINARLTPDNFVNHGVPPPIGWEERVVAEFSRFAQTSDLISQVRWITLEGQELIRINAQAGVITRVSEDQLQDKSDRHYVKNVPDGSGHQVYVSSMDVNVENKVVVRPLQPTVRGVVRIEGVIPGLLVVNYDLTKLFDTIRSIRSDSAYLEILDADGHWVMAADRQLEWGGILHPDDTYFNVKTHSPDIWQEMNAQNEVPRTFNDRRLWSLLTLYIDDEMVSQQSPMSALYFVAQSHSDELTSWRAMLIMGIVGCAVASFSLLAWLVCRQATAQFETYRLLVLVQQEKNHVEQVNDRLNTANQRLTDLQDELVEASKLSSLGLMLAGLAHEMYTPLGGARMAISSSQAWLDKEGRHLSIANRAGMENSLIIAEKNLVRAFDVVSNFKRIVSDRTAQEGQHFNLHDVVRDLVFTYEPILKKRPTISIDNQCVENISVFGYPGALSQVIQNLVDNALDHAFQASDQGVITVTAKQDDDALILTISDNGRGLSPGIKMHLFEPFTTTGRINQHTGLGLHLVSQWVNILMNGRIDVESKEGVGTAFTVTIPLNSEVDNVDLTASVMTIK
ncbi:HAMP domain-containing histidine kinase [Marinomonas sp. IMCC 4694]|nr:HAMP domain-containing histidine kinase [Marinomonas sp. IMCC 4694]